MKRRQFSILFGCIALAVSPFSITATQADPIKVATTHPLIGDLTRQVGGKHVTVVDLIKPGGDIHHFEPTASDLKAIAGVKLVLASGKNLESYLKEIKDSLGGTVPVVEVGKTIPSLKVEPGNEVFMCCPEHAKGGVDPHWWHSAENMALAAEIVAEQLGAVDKANAAAYNANAEKVAEKFTALKSWAKKELAAIPKSDRKLVTAHAAFGYFCKEFGFQMIPMLGLAAEEDYSPKYVTQAVKLIQENKIRAVFPEDQANPKILKEISQQSGVKMADALIADGTKPGEGSTFEGMLRHNVAAVVKALKNTAAGAKE